MLLENEFPAKCCFRGVNGGMGRINRKKSFHRYFYPLF
jgi:hypothetical protein